MAIPDDEVYRTVGGVWIASPRLVGQHVRCATQVDAMDAHRALTAAFEWGRRYQGKIDDPENE